MRAGIFQHRATRHVSKRQLRREARKALAVWQERLADPQHVADIVRGIMVTKGKWPR